MRKIAASILMLSLLFVSAAASAQQMKPGLWEMTMKSDAMKNMPKLSPEQMAQMKKMGVSVPQMQGGAIVTKVCVTKDMAERDAPQTGPKEAGCETRNFQRSGNSYSADVICNGPDLKGQGKVKGSFSGGERFTSSSDFKGTAGGQPLSQSQETSGKWVGADCGTVKPMGEAARKK